MVALTMMACNSQPKTPGLVAVTGGLVQGVVEDGMMIFKGIPFAAPPVGDLRWKAPQPVIPWEGVRDASEFGPSPLSSMGFPKDASEDCLYLNIWTPAKKTDEKLPVFIWYFGGGFQWGYTAEMEFDGERMARRFMENIYDIGRGFKEFGIGFVISLPYLVLWAVIILIVVLIVRGILKHNKKKEMKRRMAIQNGTGFDMYTGKPLEKKAEDKKEE